VKKIIIVKEEHRLRALENKAIMAMSGPRKHDVTGGRANYIMNTIKIMLST
jgi:hypothetical protein